MILNPKPDSASELELRHESEDGTIELGCARMLYGWRVRAGYIGTHTYSIDWCCAADVLLITATFNIAKLLIEADRIKDLPGFPAVKPWVLDDEFISKLQAVIDSANIPIKLSSLVPTFIDRYKNPDK